MASTPLEFHPDVYLGAAKEHFAKLDDLREGRSWVLLHYVAGLAVECVLRAYKARRDQALDVRHDLQRLAKKGGFWDVVPTRKVEALSRALGVLVARWDNRHRYRSEAALRKFITSRKLFPRGRGELLEESGRLIMNASVEIVTVGVERWSRQTN
jgi:hypothetical protein